MQDDRAPTQDDRSIPDDGMDVSIGNLERMTSPQQPSSPVQSPGSPESQMQDAHSDDNPDANDPLAMDEDDFDNFFELLSKRRANRASTGNEDLDEVLDEFSALFDTHVESATDAGESEEEVTDLDGKYGLDGSLCLGFALTLFTQRRIFSPTKR